MSPRTGDHQAPLSMGFPKPEYWVGCHFLLQGNFPTHGSNPGLLHCWQSPVLQVGSLLNKPPRKPLGKFKCKAKIVNAKGHVILLWTIYNGDKAINSLCAFNKPINYIVTVLGEQWRDSAVHTHVTILPKLPSHLGKRSPIRKFENEEVSDWKKAINSLLQNNVQYEFQSEICTSQILSQLRLYFQFS